jgi:general stress protein 26
MEVPFEEAKSTIIQEFKKQERGYLATSENEKVTVRQMMFINEGLKLWFITDKDTRKVRQIKSNPNVAVAMGLNLQYEGVASMKSHPLEEENRDFISAFKEKNLDIYTRSMREGRILQRKGTRVIEVTPKRIALNIWTPQWDKEEGFEPYLYVLNADSEKAYKVLLGQGGYTAKAYKE